MSTERKNYINPFMITEDQSDKASAYHIGRSKM